MHHSEELRIVQRAIFKIKVNHKQIFVAKLFPASLCLATALSA